MMELDSKVIPDTCSQCEVSDTNQGCESRRIKVLFADDDDDTLQLLGWAANRIGNFDYCLARDGGEVEQLLDTQQFDVLCFDAQMPVAYGTTIARIVRQHDIKIPIIFFTGRTGREVRLTAEEVDATVVLKPASPGHLMSLIKTLAEERNSYHGPERRTLSINTTGYQRRATDRAFSLPEPLKAVAAQRRTA